MSGDREHLSIVVVGASGHLAGRKILPALFALYCQGYLPASFNIFGFARSRLSDNDFRARIGSNLTCRYAPGEACRQRMDAFLQRCRYIPGAYDSADSFLDLYQSMRALEPAGDVNRLFYLAVPPLVFVDVARAIGDAGLVQCGVRGPWSRVVVEKPFGKDRESSDLMSGELSEVFSEEQIYRIDHYLGKEVIQNLMVLRFANLVFEPIWNRRYVESVRICWKENSGIDGRGGYFDEYGIIRDVMQNHLLQILALTAMEPPERLDARRIRDEKVKVLKSIPAARLDDLVIGQYARGEVDGRAQPGYREDPSVSDDSNTATFAAARLGVRNERWKGVPFLVLAGKGLDARMTEIKVRFRPASGSIFCEPGARPSADELVLRVQPDEAVTFKIVTKVPGVKMAMDTRTLDLHYKSSFEEIIPDAYEALLVDVLRGDKSLFIRGDELRAAWDVFTPVLHEIDRRNVVPESYAFGSRGPAGAERLCAGRHGAA